MTPPLTTNDSGAQFRVMVTNAFGAVTSTWATLTVNAANTITWTGAVSSDWNNPTNWSPQTVPTASDRVVINSGTVTIPAHPGFAVLNLNGGTLSGSFTFGSTLNWVGGDDWNAAVTIAPSGVLNISGSGGKFFYGTLNNAGTINWTGSGDIVGGGSLLHNLPSGIFNVFSDGNWGRNFWAGSKPQFDNAGLFRKSHNTGTNDLGAWFLTNTGTVDAQSGTVSFYQDSTQTSSITKLNGGGIASVSAIQVAGGALTGSGIINGSIVNAAEVSPGGSPGTITINGSYTQTSASRLTVEIGGVSPGQHGQLVVNGPATLAGTLNVTLLNGFSPSLGDEVSVLSYGSRAGNFASVVQLGLPTGLALTPTYGSSNLADWVNLSTHTPPGEVFRFVDLKASAMDHRFYRAVSP